MNLYIAENPSLMSKSDKERFNMRIGGEVILWDYLKTDKAIADIGVAITVKEPYIHEFRINKKTLYF